MYAYRNPPMLTELMREEAARATLTTPEPIYPARCDATPPERLTGADHIRALAAMHHARTRYSGAVAAVLVSEIAAYKDLGYIAQSSAPVVRLIDELMLPSS